MGYKSKKWTKIKNKGLIKENNAELLILTIVKTLQIGTIIASSLKYPKYGDLKKLRCMVSLSLSDILKR